MLSRVMDGIDLYAGYWIAGHGEPGTYHGECRSLAIGFLLAGRRAISDNPHRFIARNEAAATQIQRLMVLCDQVSEIQKEPGAILAHEFARELVDPWKQTSEIVRFAASLN